MSPSKMPTTPINLRPVSTLGPFNVFKIDGYQFALDVADTFPAHRDRCVEVEYLGRQQTPQGAETPQAAFRVIVHGQSHTGITRQEVIDLVAKEEGVLIESLLNEYFNEA